MNIILAPMEGVVDHLMRDMLTRIGGFDLCITEFVRVVDQKLPARVFTRLCPELLHGGKTPAGTPVRVQLLGQEPHWLAENALRAVELGSPGVDLNFGCPAKAVNKSRGGAVLLKETEQLYRIVKAVRDAVPADVAVSAKIRLGYDDTSLTLDNAAAIAAAGASMLTVHARTKSDGYRPPAYWPWIAKIKQQVNIPLAVNMSPLHFQQEGLKQKIQQLLLLHKVSPELLELEITENTAMHDMEKGSNHVLELQQMGIRVSIDDFGTGYSSLAYLRRMPIDKIKIDRSFVMDMAGNDSDMMIVKTMIKLAHGLGKRILAEGVETAVQLQLLKGMSCDAMQGYLVAKPLSETDALAFCKKAVSL